MTEHVKRHIHTLSVLVPIVRVYNGPAKSTATYVKELADPGMLVDQVAVVSTKRHLTVHAFRGT